MNNSNIEWTDMTWNPFVGCSKVSPGCKNCYAEKFAWRLAKNPKLPAETRAKYQRVVRDGKWTGEVEFFPERLREPFRARKPRRIFVGSMGDLFHPGVPFDFIDQVWDTMWECSQHTFLVLTKRPDRMLGYVRERAYRREFGWTERQCEFIKPGDYRHYEDITMRDECGYVDSDIDEDSDIDILCKKTGEECWHYECPVADIANHRNDLEVIGVAEQYEYDKEGFAEDCFWMQYHTRPFHAGAGNVWVGCTIENQDTYEKWIRYMRALRNSLGPHAKLFASLEPLLGPIDFKIKYWPENTGGPNWSPLDMIDYHDGAGDLFVPVLNEIITGGETGPGSRPTHPYWPRKVRDDCLAAGVSFHHKQNGEFVLKGQKGSAKITKTTDFGVLTYDGKWMPGQTGWNGREIDPDTQEAYMVRVGRNRAGHLIDGREWREWPE